MNRTIPPGPHRPRTPHRRASGRTARIGAALALAAGLATSTALPASAGTGPAARTYTCDRTYVGHKGKGWGYLACTASPGLPLLGRIDGEFLIRSRQAGDPAFACRNGTEQNFPSGEATLPDRVLGFHCDRLTS